MNELKTLTLNGKTYDAFVDPVARENGGGAISKSNIFYGRTASFYGDSLTEANYHYIKGYHQWVKDILGLASYNNYGVSGFKVSDVYTKVNSVNDTADIIFVMCGVNDQNFSVPLGTLGDTTAGTTYGALDMLCTLLKQKYPTKLVVFVTPHYQTKYPHKDGVTSYEVSKAVREVCEKYAIPVYDNFVLSGIYSTNLSTFTTDNCHWNDIAHEMVGKNLAGFMVNTFQYIHSNSAKEKALEIINGDSVTAFTYENQTLTLAGLNDTFGGVLFTNAVEVQIELGVNDDIITEDGKTAIGWLCGYDSGVYHAMGVRKVEQIGNAIETYDFSGNPLAAKNNSIKDIGWNVDEKITLRVENGNVNMYFDDSEEPAFSVVGTAIAYIASAYKTKTLHGVTFV